MKVKKEKKKKKDNCIYIYICLPPSPPPPPSPSSPANEFCFCEDGSCFDITLLQYAAVFVSFPIHGARFTQIAHQLGRDGMALCVSAVPHIASVLRLKFWSQSKQSVTLPTASLRRPLLDHLHYDVGTWNKQEESRWGEILLFSWFVLLVNSGLWHLYSWFDACLNMFVSYSKTANEATSF